MQYFRSKWKNLAAKQLLGFFYHHIIPLYVRSFIISLYSNPDFASSIENTLSPILS